MVITQVCKKMSNTKDVVLQQHKFITETKQLEVGAPRSFHSPCCALCIGRVCPFRCSWQIHQPHPSISGLQIHLSKVLVCVKTCTDHIFFSPKRTFNTAASLFIKLSGWDLVPRHRALPYPCPEVHIHHAQHSRASAVVCILRSCSESLHMGSWTEGTCTNISCTSE